MAGYKYGLDDVIRAMNETIDPDPNRRDEAARNGQGGRYTRRGKPCCLIGEVLVNLGASVGTLKDLDRDAELIDDSGHPFWKRFDPLARDLMGAMQKQNDRGEQWGRIKWNLFRIDPYWLKENPKFAYAGSWCTLENGHVSERYSGPKF